MTCRNVLRAFAGAAAAAVLAGAGAPAHGQPSGRTARVGILCAVTCDTPAVVAFKDGLAKLGWVDGRNLVLDLRDAGGNSDRLPLVARELAATAPDLIVAGNPQSAQAAKAATATIPIVFVAVADPVAVGLVTSLARPGGNATGMMTLAPGGFIAKSLQLIRELAPGARRVAVLLNPANDVARIRYAEEGPSAAARLGLQVQVFDARDPAAIAPAIDAAVRGGADVLYVPGDPMFHTPADRLPPIVNRAGLPSMFVSQEVVRAGGLMSYGPDFLDMFRSAARPADRILRGASPAAIPVEQPTTYRLVVNLGTAKAIGFAVPRSLLLRADEVIP